MVRTCPQCLGEKSVTCQRCHGQGKVVDLLSNRDCPDCKGVGVIRCPRCWGSGKID